MALEQLGKYKVGERIGRGAMGEVFKAFDPVLKRDVAIKVISASLSADNDLRQRFEREAQAAAKMNHPNIITVFDYGEEQGTIYMAMELLEGADLRNLIGQEDILPTLEDKLDIMGQICEGLAYAHSKEVIHRDLKPGNIHVQPNSQVKIMDFGLARLGGSEMTRTGTVMGTPHYMSPEQVLGDKVEVSSDVFSIGAVFYELLSNHKPFDGDSAHAVLFQVVNKHPEPVRNWNPDLPTILVEVVEGAMAKDRKKRYQNAGELREALALARRAIREGRGNSTLAAESAAGLAAPKSASDSFKSIPPRSRAPIPSNQQLTEGTIGVGSSPPRSATPVPNPPTLPTSKPPVSVRPPGPPAGAASLASQPPPRVAMSPPARSGRPASSPPRSIAPVRAPSRVPLYVGGAILVVALAAGIYFLLLPGIVGPPSPSASGGDVRVSALTDALISTQVELARRDLDDKNYAAAILQADRVLKLSAGSVEAHKIKETAQAFLKDLDAAAAEAKARLDAGDMDGASAALGRVLAIDPKHPVAAELSANLNQFFRSQAEDAQREAARARAQAEKAQASSAPGFAQATAASREAEAFLAKGEFAVATQGFLDARDSFDRTRRAAEAQARETPKPTADATPMRQPPSRGAAATLVPPTLPPAAQATPAPEETPKSVSLIPPRKSFVAGETVVRSGSQKKGPAGFDNEDVSVNPDFLCRIRFDATPAAVRVGENYNLKVYLINDGDKTIKLRDLTLTTTANGARSAKPVIPQAREISGRQAGLLADVSGALEERATSWSLEASVVSQKGDVCRNQVTWK